MTFPSLIPSDAEIPRTSLIYQYLRTKIILFSFSIEPRKRFIASRRSDDSSPSSHAPRTSESSSSIKSVSAEPRLSADFFLILSIDIPRTSFPRKAESFSGLAGGMRFQRRRYASFTHSSASSSSPRMFFAMYPQSFPYFSLVRAIPSSERAKNKSTIFSSSKAFPPFRSVKAPYTYNNRKKGAKGNKFSKIFFEN